MKYTALVKAIHSATAQMLRRFLEAARERIESLMPAPADRKRAPRQPKS